MSGQAYLINSTTANVQFDSTQAVFGDGQILVAWQSEESADYPNEIRVRILSPDGSPGPADFVVNTTAEEQNQISVTTLPDGNVLVAWSSTDLTTGGSDIHARVVESNGAIGPEFILNSGANSAEVGVAAATLTNGETLVASYTSGAGSPSDIVGHFLNADGTPTGSEFTINSTLSGLQFQPAVAAMPDGNAFVTWVHSSGQGDDVLYGRILNPDGTANAADFKISSSDAIDQLGPRVTALAHDHVLVTWSSGGAIEGRIFDGHGAAMGQDFLISPAGGSGVSSAESSVTALADGRAVVVWAQDNGSSDAIYARVVNADGTMSHPEFIVNSATGLGESAPHVSELPNGEIFVTWTSSAGLNEDIYGQLLRLDGTVYGTEGKDTHFGSAAHELFGAGENDTLTGQGGGHVLSGGTGHNLPQNNLGNDTFPGGTGTDAFAGGTGNNRSWGNSGNHAPSVGAASDTLAPGVGADNFVFKDIPASMPGHQNQLVDLSRTDGNHVDRLGIDANTHATGDQHFTFPGDSASTSVGGQPGHANHILEGDVHGNGTGDLQIHVNVAALHAADLIL